MGRSVGLASTVPSSGKHRIRIDEITSIDDVNDAAPAQRVWFKVRNVDADRDTAFSKVRSPGSASGRNDQPD